MVRTTTTVSPLAQFRQSTGAVVRQLLGPPPPMAAPGDHDPGLFGPTSVTWQIHAHMAMLVGGIRSLLVQTLHPLAMAGVADYSAYEDDPLGRLQRTAGFIASTTYGSTAQAIAAVEAVRRVHSGVSGTAPDGRPYRADDPALLSWVHHVEVESFLLAYQRIGPGLDTADSDRYVAEMATVGRLMGASPLMTDVAGLRAFVSRHPEQMATAQARRAVRFLVYPPLPARARAPYAVLLAAAINLVPLRQRLPLGLVLPGPIGGRVACEPAARALVGLLGWAMGPSPARDQALARSAG